MYRRLPLIIDMTDLFVVDNYYRTWFLWPIFLDISNLWITLFFPEKTF
jgi:hypothetical protein